MIGNSSRTLGRVMHLRARALVTVAAVLAACSMVSAGCSRTSDLGSIDETTTIARHPSTTDPLDSQPLDTGRAAVQQLQAIINTMLASNSVCDILTQKDVPKGQLDPSLLTSSTARTALSDGLVKMFDHLVQIGPPELTGAFTAQKQIFTQVLAVVNQYANDPGNSQVTEQINTIVESPGYLAAQAQITAWVGANCH